MNPQTCNCNDALSAIVAWLYMVERFANRGEDSRAAGLWQTLVKSVGSNAAKTAHSCNASGHLDKVAELVGRLDAIIHRQDAAEVPEAKELWRELLDAARRADESAGSQPQGGGCGA